MVFALAMSAMVPFQTVATGPAPVNLGSAAHFAILAHSTITGTGGGIVNGDLGLSPAGSVVILPAQVNGIIYNGDAIAAQAQIDLAAAISAASPAQLPGGVVLSDLELGGRVLAPGIYKSGSSYGISLANLTLNGGPDDVWIFQMASTLTVGVGIQVVLTNGAQARNIFWQVGSSATMDTSSAFKGTIMAAASITMNASSTIDGRALAQTAAVTFGGAAASLPAPEAPRFTSVVRTTPASATVILSTTPYYLMTLLACPDLLHTNWTTIVAEIPTASPWTFTDDSATAAVTQRFYRVFITAY